MPNARILKKKSKNQKLRLVLKLIANYSLICRKRNRLVYQVAVLKSRCVYFADRL